MAKVLVIDDEPEMLQGLATLLQLKNHVVFSASNGVEGLAIIQNEQLDLIISDLKMPHMDGLELLQAIRAEEQFAHIPVILLSAFVTEDDVRNSHQLDIQEVLSKPIRVEDFYTIVAKYV